MALTAGVSCVAAEVPLERRLPAAVVLLFATTLFLSSFLMFLVEPMAAKAVLPLLGGAPMVWNTCVMFFQIVLVAGYAYAHMVNSWLGSRRHTIVYAVLLMVPFATLPFSVRDAAAWRAHGNPIAWLLVVLVSSIGLPFFVLTTTASVLQKWFSETDHPAAEDPYFLYTASNLGSLFALVSYPVIVEPMLRLGDQSRLWAIGYAVFVGLALLCAALVSRRAAAHSPSFAHTPIELAGTVPLSRWRRVRWVALSFIPSSLLLGVTSYLSTDIAAVPLMWTVPLFLYLFTFVLAFSSRGDSWRAIADRRLPLPVVAVAVLMLFQGASRLLWLVIPIHLLAFTLAAMLCHGELAKDRPAASHLTEFYFWIAFGGMVGGVFNTLAAPLLFNGIVEYPLVLVLACFIRQGGASDIGSDRHRVAMDIVVPVAVGALAAGLMVGAVRFGSPRFLYYIFLPAMLTFSQLKRSRRFALSIGSMLLGASLAGAAAQVLYSERTFFGVYRVKLEGTLGAYHSLVHGTTLHGMQAVDRARQNEPMTYYDRTGPFGQAFDQLPHAASAPEIAVAGLGVGSLASYAGIEQHWTFYEIDPAVERIARSPQYFTYLRKCGGRCQVVLGDARLSLASARPHQYGLIVLDAFSSDAIPVHLMTAEALTLFLTRLAPAGALAFHVSNRHLSLGPVLARLAISQGLTVLERQDDVTAAQVANGKAASDWLVMGRDSSDLGPLIADTRWRTPAVTASTPLWTDDFSNILSVLNLDLPGSLLLQRSGAK